MLENNNNDTSGLGAEDELAIIAGLQAARENEEFEIDAIRDEVRELLDKNDIDTSCLDNDSILEQMLRNEVNHDTKRRMGLAGAIESVASAIYVVDMKLLPHKDDPRVAEEIFKVSAYAYLTIGFEDYLDPTTKTVFNEIIQSRIEKPDIPDSRQLELFAQVSNELHPSKSIGFDDY